MLAKLRIQLTMATCYKLPVVCKITKKLLLVGPETGVRSTNHQLTNISA